MITERRQSLGRLHELKNSEFVEIFPARALETRADVRRNKGSHATRRKFLPNHLQTFLYSTVRETGASYLIEHPLKPLEYHRTMTPKEFKGCPQFVSFGGVDFLFLFRTVLAI